MLNKAVAEIPLKNPIGGALTIFGAKVFNRSRPAINSPPPFPV